MFELPLSPSPPHPVSFPPSLSEPLVLICTFRLRPQLLLPGAVSAWQEALAAAFTAGADQRRRSKDALSKASGGHVVSIVYAVCGCHLNPKHVVNMLKKM